MAWGWPGKKRWWARRGRLARSARLITAEDKAKEVARTPGAISFAAPGSWARG